MLTQFIEGPLLTHSQKDRKRYVTQEPYFVISYCEIELKVYCFVYASFHRAIVFIHEVLQMKSCSSVETSCPKHMQLKRKKRLIFEMKQNFFYIQSLLSTYVLTYEVNNHYFYKHFTESTKECSKNATQTTAPKWHEMFVKTQKIQQLYFRIPFFSKVVINEAIVTYLSTGFHF